MQSFLDNILLNTDSYKISHWKQYPPGTEKVYSYFESRSGAKFNRTVFFGLQYFLKRYLEGKVVTAEKINEAEEIFNLHFGGKVFNREGWEYILHNHDGKLPVVIKAVPEGSIIPESNVMMTVENTDPKVFWLTNFLETLLVQVWYPCTVATQSRAMKQIIGNYLAETGDPSLIDFKLHDFGFRGVTCPEQAALGGAAHLVNFQGTDTVAGLVLTRKFYGDLISGFSIPASEHSTITSWGEQHEVDAMRNMLEKYPTGLVACVSDSFDIFKACSELWGTTLKDRILQRDGVLVVRPDSGEPTVMVPTVLNLLGEKFGTITNEKGYKVLHPKVRVIQGDGIDFSTLEDILKAVKDRGWSADNVAFGSGGGLLQKLNRDTQRFAFKCSSVTVNGQERDVFKRPITDQVKSSKAGRLKLVYEFGSHGPALKTIPFSDNGEDQLQTVFKDGVLSGEQKFSEIRKRAKG